MPSLLVDALWWHFNALGFYADRCDLLGISITTPGSTAIVVVQTDTDPIVVQRWVLGQKAVTIATLALEDPSFFPKLETAVQEAVEGFWLVG